MHPVAKILVFGSVMAVLPLLACSSGHGDRHPTSNGPTEQVGSIGLQFHTPDGITIDSVDYQITGPTNLSGTVDVTQAVDIGFVVGGLAAGSGYSIKLTAT